MHFRSSLPVQTLSPFGLNAGSLKETMVSAMMSSRWGYDSSRSDPECRDFPELRTRRQHVLIFGSAVHGSTWVENAKRSTTSRPYGCDAQLGDRRAARSGVQRNLSHGSREIFVGEWGRLRIVKGSNSHSHRPMVCARAFRERAKRKPALLERAGIGVGVRSFLSASLSGSRCREPARPEAVSASGSHPQAF